MIRVTSAILRYLCAEFGITDLDHARDSDPDAEEALLEAVAKGTSLDLL